jgi:carboxyvinyl-carboxyphosphonate phosphorylmutase
MNLPMNWPMNWSARRERFRQLINGDTCHFPVSVFDPMTARMAEDLGFEMGMLAGSVSAMAILGAPDKILITASEFADLAHRICRAGDLALVVDADHGYGNALNVERCVAQLDHAGISAMTIEDTDLPQPFGASKPQLLSIEEGVGKMQAALAGRSDPNFVIIARTSAIAISDREDCLQRVKAYEAAGVDAIALIGVKEQDDLEYLCAATALPIMLGGVPADLLEQDYLSRLGVRICLKGHQPFMAAVQAAYEAMLLQAAGEQATGAGPTLASGELIKQLTRDENITSAAKKYLKS